MKCQGTVIYTPARSKAWKGQKSYRCIMKHRMCANSRSAKKHRNQAVR